MLEKSSECDVWCKLNILLYAGETEETIKETLEWLKQNKFKGISVNPFILYLNGEETKVFIDKIKNITQMDVDIEGLYENGYSFIDLSSEITSQIAKDKCKKIAENCMQRQDYLDLKKICYTRRN